jgi:hypothetical protein
MLTTESFKVQCEHCECAVIERVPTHDKQMIDGNFDHLKKNPVYFEHLLGSSVITTPYGKHLLAAKVMSSSLIDISTFAVKTASEPV